jgi:hypothetical protein
MSRLYFMPSSLSKGLVLVIGLVLIEIYSRKAIVTISCLIIGVVIILLSAVLLIKLKMFISVVDNSSVG